MICLSCDIHHASLNLPYNPYCEKSELQVTRELLKLLEKHNVKATMFITGKCFTEEWEDVKPICDHPLVEIGGHNYFCFQPALLHRIWNKAFKNYNGPRPYQSYDVKKTIDIIYKKSGRGVTSWRNHMYVHGPNTDDILSKRGITICSDEVKAAGAGPVLNDGIYNFPINIIPDYDHLYHAHRTEKWVKWWVDMYKHVDDFGTESYYIDQWAEIAMKQLKEKESGNITANVLIHPMSQYICDKFKCLEEILEYIGSKENCLYNEVQS